MYITNMCTLAAYILVIHSFVGSGCTKLQLPSKQRWWDLPLEAHAAPLTNTTETDSSMMHIVQ